MLPCNYSTQLQQDSAQMLRTGTVSDGSSGLSGMQLLSHGVHAIKAVAMLPQGLVHLVAGAHCVGQRGGVAVRSSHRALIESKVERPLEESDCGEIVTTFENNLARDQNAVFIGCRSSTDLAVAVSRVPADTVRKAYRGCAWVWTNSTGYLLPPGQTVLLTNSQRVTFDTSGVVPVPLFSLAVSHTHEGATASCVTVPGVALSDMPAIAATTNNITIAQNNPGLQAVWDGGHNSAGFQGRLLAALWEPGVQHPLNLSSDQALGLSAMQADRPCLVIVQQSSSCGSFTVAASDPTNNPLGVTVSESLSLSLALIVALALALSPSSSPFSLFLPLPA